MIQIYLLPSLLKNSISTIPSKFISIFIPIPMLILPTSSYCLLIFCQYSKIILFDFGSHLYSSIINMKNIQLSINIRLYVNILFFDYYYYTSIQLFCGACFPFPFPSYSSFRLLMKKNDFVFEF